MTLFLILLASISAHAQGFILTGAPGAGKSSVAVALEIRGEVVVHEAAVDVFRFHAAQGVNEPWLLPNIQEQIATLQIQRESRIGKDLGRYFLDRSVLDGAAYLRLLEQARTERALDLIASGDVDRYAGRVFLFLSPPVLRTDHNAMVTMSAEIEEALRLVYTSLGFEVIDVPYGPLRERVEFVLAAARRPLTKPDAAAIASALLKREYLDWKCGSAL